MDDDDGRTTEHGHPIISPCESSAQVILKSLYTVWLVFVMKFLRTLAVMSFLHDI